MSKQFVGYYNDKKQPVVDFINNSLAEYRQQHGKANLVLVHESNSGVVIEGVLVVCDPFIAVQKNSVLIGWQA